MVLASRALALEQLGFATQFVMGIGITVVAAAGCARLAFGLGCRELRVTSWWSTCARSRRRSRSATT